MSASAGHDVLERIAAGRRQRVEAMKLERPAHVLRARIAPRQAARFERALRRDGPAGPLRLLCEVKRASPSKGPLDLAVDPVERAALYERGGAAAVSLVTEPEHFLGDPDWVDAVRPKVGIPILMKDFVVDSWQLLDAAARGADAVLLLASLLSEIQIQRYLGEARLLGLDALVEVHDEAELAAALAAGATVIGVNNRDLRTFAVRKETALELIPKLPVHVTAVAESGISTADDLAALRAIRCDAVLVGEALMTGADPAATLAGLQAAARG